MATLQDAMTIARSVINDTDATNYRYADPDLLDYGNRALAEICRIAPRLFYQTSNMTCVQGAPLQRLDGTISLKLVDILSIVGGGVVTLKDREAISAADPGWMGGAQAPAEHWCPFLDDPNGFLLYPLAPANQSLLTVYVKPPATLLATDPFPIAPAYVQNVADYIVGMSQARDDIAVNTQLMAASFQRFYAAFQAAMPAQAPAPNQ